MFDCTCGLAVLFAVSVVRCDDDERSGMAAWRCTGDTRVGSV